jgi:hypothetical protein
VTHYPLMIGSLRRNQVRILVQEDSRPVSSESEYDPIRIAMKGLLTSELYGLRSTLAPEWLAKLGRYYGLLRKKGKTDSEQAVLTHLVRELNELGVLANSSEPLLQALGEHDGATVRGGARGRPVQGGARGTGQAGRRSSRRRSG